MDTPLSIEGVVVLQRSEGPDADACICCEGAHVYSCAIRPEPFDTPWQRGATSVHDWVNWMVSTHSTDWEGKRVRVVLEVIESEEGLSEGEARSEAAEEHLGGDTAGSASASGASR